MSNPEKENREESSCSQIDVEDLIEMGAVKVEIIEPKPDKVEEARAEERMYKDGKVLLTYSDDGTLKYVHIEHGTITIDIIDRKIDIKFKDNNSEVTYKWDYKGPTQETPWFIRFKEDYDGFERVANIIKSILLSIMEDIKYTMNQEVKEEE
jgi:hypothetical protein